jgi:hypothetical protein
MPFCPTCKSEFRPGFGRCEDCDAALVAELPAPPSPPVRPEIPNPGFRTVYSTTEPQDALLMEMLLERSGIDAEVENERSGFSAVGFPTGAAPIAVTVPSADARNAEEIIRQALKSRTTPPGFGSWEKGMWLWVFALILLPILAMTIFELFDVLGR